MIYRISRSLFKLLLHYLCIWKFERALEIQTFFKFPAKHCYSNSYNTFSSTDDHVLLHNYFSLHKTFCMVYYKVSILILSPTNMLWNKPDARRTHNFSSGRPFREQGRAMASRRHFRLRGMSEELSFITELTLMSVKELWHKWTPFKCKTKNYCKSRWLWRISSAIDYWFFLNTLSSYPS